jgi:release factor glutamine methyltransferase
MSIKQTYWHKLVTNIAATLLDAKAREIAALDAEILLAHALDVSRAYLYAFPEQELTASQAQTIENLFAKKQAGMPVAYLTQQKEFWSLRLTVSPATLIPRPETEMLVEFILEKLPSTLMHVADLGTGSGAIALAIANERPEWQVYASDQSTAALAVAQLNSANLNINNIIWLTGDWCNALGNDLTNQLDAIISNPPYIAANDPHLLQPELTYEPQSALIAAEAGLKDLRLIITSAQNYLRPGGYLLLEHGYDQAKAVQKLLLENGYEAITTLTDLSNQDRVTVAKKPTT